MFFEHLADEDDAALMRLFFDVGVFCFIAGSVLFRYGKYAGRALKVMQAVSRFSSKRPFLVPLARVLTKSSASSTEIPVKMLISPTAYTSFCCFECKRSSVAMLSDPQYQTQCKV